MGGVRPNASENGQISPSIMVCDARGDSNCPNCAYALQGTRKTTNMQDSSGVIWGIPVKWPRRFKKGYATRNQQPYSIRH
jgi:hypothetical protein